MTQLIIRGKNLEVTEAIRNHVYEKFDKALQNFQALTTKIDINLSVPRHGRGQPQQIAEATVYASGTVIRAEENQENLYTSIDLVAEKLIRQLQRYKDRLQRRDFNQRSPDDRLDPALTSPEVTALDTDRIPELPPAVVRSKFFAMPPLSVQQALDNLQMIDHDFYMFCNAETGKINVIYERDHGGYGIIQPHKLTS